MASAGVTSVGPSEGIISDRRRSGKRGSLDLQAIIDAGRGDEPLKDVKLLGPVDLVPDD
jgi:hypothetical protein